MTDEAAPEPNRVRAVLAFGTLALVAAVLARSAWISLEWPLEIDAPLLHYMAFAVERGAVPYRDLFVTSFPGAILFHLAILETVGSGDRAFAVVNLLWLAGVLVATFLALRPLGARVALAAGASFGAIYLHGGPYIALQRDAVTILPIALALALAVARRGPADLRALAIGALFGLAASIKPHSAMGLPVVLALGDLGPGGARGLLRRALVGGIGFALPLALLAGWLVASGGWAPFLQMVREYLPLHLELSGHHEELVGAERVRHLVRKTLSFGPEAPWLVAGVPGALLLLFAPPEDERARRVLRLIGTLAALYLLYPALAGQFWNYHWLPFEYFLALLTGLCLLETPRLRALGTLGALPALFLVAALFVSDAADVPRAPEEPTARALAGEERMPKRVAYHHRVREISAFLAAELRPGDRVQPLDWVAGGVHAMLVAEAELATPYVSDYHFYHHVAHPEVRALRADFLVRLRAEPPRFIVDMRNVPRPKGEGAGDFDTLFDWIRANYRSARRGKDWIVWERRG